MPVKPRARAKKWPLGNLPFKASGHQGEHTCKDDNGLEEEHCCANGVIEKVPTVGNEQFEHFGGQNKGANDKVTDGQIDNVTVNYRLHFLIREHRVAN